MEQDQAVAKYQYSRRTKNHKVHTSGLLNVVVEVENKVEMVTLNVVERLAINILMGCDYCIRYVEGIKNRQGIVELDT